MKQRSCVQPWCSRTPLLGTILLLGVFLSCAAKVAIGAEDDRPPGPAGDRWAVLVGVNKYKHIRPELSYCAADVRALGELLIKAGFGKERVVIVHDQATDPELLPTKANIEKQLALTLDSVGPDDFVLLAFSGHGVRLEQQSYLCPFDAKMDPADLVAVNSVYQRLQECRARFKLFLVDACQDDRSRPKELVATRAAGDVSPLVFGHNDALPPGLLLLSSCSPGQESVEEPKFGHGVFTHFLLEGLAGQADADKSGSVSLLEWTGYASSKTRAYVRSLDRVQNPSMRGDFPDFELVQNVRLVRAKEAMKKGDELRKDHKDAEALEQFRLATELAPENAEAHCKLGDAHLFMYDRGSALAAFDRAIDIDPESAEAHLGRARVLCADYAFDQAATELDAVVRITTRLSKERPSDPMPFLLRAEAYRLKKDDQNSLADASEAIRLDAKNVEAYRTRAIAFANLNKFDETIADCMTAISLDPQDGDLYAIRAVGYGARGSLRRDQADSEKAIADAADALRLDPKNVEAYRARAIVCHLLGRNDEAIADCGAGLALDPKYGELYVERALAYNERGLARQDKADWEKAVADATEALRLDAGNVEAYRARAMPLNNLARYDEAIADGSKALALAPEFGDLYCVRSFAYNGRGLARQDNADWEKAVADAAEALRLDPEYVEAYKCRAAPLNNLRRFDEAIADCSKAIALDPKYGDSYRVRAYAYNGKGDHGRAIADCDKALEIDPNNAEAKKTREAAIRAKGAK